MRSYWWGLGILLTAAALPATAGEPATGVQPTGLFGGQRGGSCAQPCPTCPGYAPGVMVVPGQVMPGQVMPGQVLPGTQPGTTQPGTTQPGAEQPAPSSLESPAGAGSAFAGAGEAGTGAVASAAQYTFGDLIGIQGRVNQPFSGGSFGRSSTGFASVPLVSRYGGIKISDLESPRPADRVYFSYNYYYNADPASRPAGADRIDVHREMVGFEKTVLGSTASFGMRLPYNQVTGGVFSDDNLIGDLSMTFKYAFINDCKTGNVLSGGLALTLPTGERGSLNPLVVQTSPASAFTNPVTGAITAVPATFATVAQPDLTTRSVLFQPWTGGIYNLGPLSVISFTSIIVPTDSRDPTVWISSIQLAYNLIQPNPCGCGDDRLLNGLTPVLELHSTTPLNHRNADSGDIFLTDQLNLTTGAYFTIRRAIIGAAVCVPLVGPKPFDLEAITNLQFRF